jgi:hypothetical protein
MNEWKRMAKKKETGDGTQPDGRLTLYESSSMRPPGAGVIRGNMPVIGDLHILPQGFWKSTHPVRSAG